MLLAQPLIHKRMELMYADWITSSNGLPREGQQIEFVLDCRSVAIEGIYEQLSFQSQWAKYAVGRVRSWRNLTQECDLATPARNQAACVLSSTPTHDVSHHPLRAGGLTHAA